MTLRTMTMDAVSYETVCDYAFERARLFPQYEGALSFVYDAYKEACRHNLRYDRKTHVMRDNRLGELQRPAGYTPHDLCAPDEARFYMARKIWCAAIRNFNAARA